MKQVILIFIYCYVLYSSLPRVLSLRCRTGNQQSDDQFQKIMQVCRRRFLGYDRENGRDYNGRDTDSQESSDSDSDEELFDNKFLSSGSSGGNRYNMNDKNGNNNNRYDYSGSSSRNMTRQSSGRNWSNNRSNMNMNNYGNDQRSSYDNSQMGSNRRNMRNNPNNGMDSRNYGENSYSNRNNNNNYNMNRNNNYNNNNNNNNNNYNNDNNNNTNGEREQAVDQRGFPERSAVIGIMTQNIQDPELRDFIEESITECYHFLYNNGRQEKCQFSQNLLSCLVEKGSERCEDWDDK